MNNYQIYLAGGMQGLTFDEMNGWRNKIIKSLKPQWEMDTLMFSGYPSVKCINPCDFYNFETVEYKTQREVMEYDLHRVRTSQLIIVDFTHKPNSIGTTMELAVAREHRIPIIGVCIDNAVYDTLHPWQIECCTRLCKSYDELIEHIKKFYLI